jgi:hypothetical protein
MENQGGNYFFHNNREQVRAAYEILLRINNFGPRFKNYCKLLEQHIWAPIVSAQLIRVDISATDRSIMDILEEFDQRQGQQ